MHAGRLRTWSHPSQTYSTFLQRDFLFSYHISVYTGQFRFTCVFFHKSTVLGMSAKLIKLYGKTESRPSSPRRTAGAPSSGIYNAMPVICDAYTGAMLQCHWILGRTGDALSSPCSFYSVLPHTPQRHPPTLPAKYSGTH